MDLVLASRGLDTGVESAQSRAPTAMSLRVWPPSKDRPFTWSETRTRIELRIRSNKYKYRNDIQRHHSTLPP
jgi:hypothetical protein